VKNIIYEKIFFIKLNIYKYICIKYCFLKIKFCIIEIGDIGRQLKLEKKEK